MNLTEAKSKLRAAEKAMYDDPTEENIRAAANLQHKVECLQKRENGYSVKELASTKDLNLNNTIR